MQPYIPAYGYYAANPQQSQQQGQQGAPQQGQPHPQHGTMPPTMPDPQAYAQYYAMYPPQAMYPIDYSKYPHQPMMVKPKRKQVKNACVNCQKACKKCDEGRPCQRCIKYGLSDSCQDSVRKERKKGIKRGPYKRRNQQGSSSATDPAAVTPGPAGGPVRGDGHTQFSQAYPTSYENFPSGTPSGYAPYPYVHAQQAYYPGMPYPPSAQSSHPDQPQQAAAPGASTPPTSAALPAAITSAPVTSSPLASQTSTPTMAHLTPTNTTGASTPQPISTPSPQLKTDQQ
ncbi:hypothetical protein DM01DRAFT_1401702 [Hesseltinella vesiculosa]|uniref:Zn(2)-C6 fungal-type domain-containing protein n=1 Tax=Hesseltinella vesiculosa TaxID=101127 RepID=A0A1X2GMK2_9FUNG|nr:hypothetical protein DM01DRAFT_1401702 [Hesseltinella vesiculosa]